MQNITKILLIFIFSLSLSATSTFAENDPEAKGSETGSPVKISGIIKDIETDEELVCAKIEIVELDKKVFTDLRGKFNITGLAPGDITLRVSYIAYEEKEITVSSAKIHQDELVIRLRQL